MTPRPETQRPTDRRDVTLRVNGAPHVVSVEPRRLLSDALRHDCGLTGTHVGCEHGVCGACTVLVDGVPARSCLMLAVASEEVEITTVEGLTRADDSLSPVQQAFRTATGCSAGSAPPGSSPRSPPACATTPPPPARRPGR